MTKFQRRTTIFEHPVVRDLNIPKTSLQLQLTVQIQQPSENNLRQLKIRAAW